MNRFVLKDWGVRNLNERLNRPKGFGEILDAAFTLCKQYFSKFFLIVLMIVGPLYLLQSMVLLLIGNSFLREAGSGSNWFDQALNSFNATANTTLSEDFANMGVGILTYIFMPVAQAAVLLAVSRLKTQHDFEVSRVVKQAFAKFWLILGSSLIFGIILFAMIFIPFVVIIIFGTLSMVADPVSGIAIMIFLLLTVGFTAAYFLTRWSFYLGTAVFENNIPGLGKSWHLTRENSWRAFGIYIVFFLIFFAVSFAIETVSIALLGNSVLYSIIMNLVTLLTTTVFTVGYAILYFDLKIRQDGDDLKHMIDDYQNNGT
ncbi:hypothetical protein GCM10007063_16300 [Lentibacillus kapialis]|uniref:Glycerophosphoryl diester phosphodiesterase membrane domain-containing protein n=1 Tax=Lentibacillus kapialis TaxID=340214 RepID=A0A917PW81_9BACI|nr:hypothetical protein [Lentibacillus kapialis]GGJ94544.1 hypothetical protein GCM10007063_16300 [Lentibacillus kapialis]